jgi:DNA repair protein RecO (recombination protein O)
MSLVVTEAILLHAFDYLESSRIVRLLTRDGGVQSALARGARRSRGRYGSSLDLFAQGTAELHTKPQRDLHTLSSFDLTKSRPGLALDVSRFTAASAVSELALRFAGEDSGPILYDTVDEALDSISAAEPDHTVAAGLASCWRIVAALGFTPALEGCALCHAELDPAAESAFSHVAGGALCARCSALTPSARSLPATARAAIIGWLEEGHREPVSPAEGRAHQRLVREFLSEHLDDGRPLRAFPVWEEERWTAA